MGRARDRASADLNGQEFILDADADTSISADTDDQIDIKIAGADDFAFKANTFEVQTGSNIDMNGTELILDADGDTSITADTDDTIDVKVGGSDKIRIDSSGRLLMGATTAESFAPSTTPQVQIEGTDHHTSSAAIIRNSNDNGQALLILGKSRGTSIGSDTVVQDDDGVGEVLFTAADGSDRTPQVASVRASVDGTPGSNDMPGRLEFYTTADGSQTITERMRIDSGGRVGIGVTDPTQYNSYGNGLVIEKSSVSGSSGMSLISATDGYGSIYFNDGTGNNTVGRIEYYHGSGAMGFATEGSEKMKLTSTGELQVNGDINTNIQVTNSKDGSATGLIRVDADASSYSGSTRAFVADFTGTAHSSAQIGFQLEGSAGIKGSIVSTGNTTCSYVTSSDERLKTDIEDLTDGLATINKIRPRKFKWISEGEDAKHDHGFVAQELHEDYDCRAVIVGGDDPLTDPWSVGNEKLVPMLVKALQEADAKIEALTLRVKTLEDA